MNYQNIYIRLIEHAKQRTVQTGYVEKHHILPRSLGGKDEIENMVSLTAREHFIAHLLLAKIYGGKMIYAVFMMSTRKGYTNRDYENLRIEFGKQVSANKERGLKISRKLTGIPKTEEHKNECKNSRTNGGGWVVSEKRKLELSDNMTGKGNPMWGKTHSLEARKIISDANKQKIICPHCNKEGGIAIMKRWHFENCKRSPNPIPRKKYIKKICTHCGKEGAGAQMTANHFDNCKNKS